MAFKLTQKQYDYVKETYDEIVMKGVLNNQRIIKAYKMLYNIEDKQLVNVKQAKRTIYAFFTHKWDHEIIDEEQPIIEIEEEDVHVQDQITDLENELLNEQLSGNEKRSIKMKLNHLYKKLEE